MLRSSLIIVSIIGLLSIVPSPTLVRESPLAYTPLPPDAGTKDDTPPQIETPQAPDYPTELLIPSISIHSTIEQVGVNDEGEMDVPSGSTKNVGWYKYGTVPGDTGSAVIDAHVYAAFNALRYLKVGSDIYVTTQGGKQLHFTVTDSRIYGVSEVPLNTLFNKNDGHYLNLITCAGKYINKLSTYDHRLVVYATLVD